MSKKFPDLTGDGKVTQADILKGRKVFADGGSLMMPEERQQYGKGALVVKVWKALDGKASKADKKLAEKVLKTTPTNKRHSDRAYVSRSGFNFDDDTDTEILLKKDYPEGSLEFQGKFLRAWQKKAKTFSHNGKKYITEEGRPEMKLDKDVKSAGVGIGSLMVPPEQEEREQFGKGSIVRKIVKSLSEKVDPAKEPKAVAGQIDPEIQKDIEDIINELEFVSSPDRDGMTKEDLQKHFKSWIKDDLKRGEVNLGVSDYSRTYDLTDPQEFMGALEDKIVSLQEANVGKVLSKRSHSFFRRIDNMLRDAYPKYDPTREAKSKGGVIVDLMASILGKKATAKKLDMAEKAKVADAVQEELDINPNFFDELTDDEFDYLMARMPQEERAMLGVDEAPLDDMVELMRGMAPKEAAQQLELFGSERNIYEYADSLKPQELREFVGNVKKEDYEIFGNFENFLERLGPRQVKAHGGMMGLLIPAEGIKPDAEMEEDYVSYVMDETLSDDEIEYVNKALEADDKLSELFDKIVLSSAEFTGSGEVDGPGTGTSDEIPARLSDGEFVFTKKAVDVIGAENLEAMMKDAEAQAERQNKAVGGIINDPTQDEKANLPDQAMSDEQIEEQMLEANRIPSLMNR